MIKTKGKNNKTIERKGSKGTTETIEMLNTQPEIYVNFVKCNTRK